MIHTVLPRNQPGVLYDGINQAATNREKADLCVIAFWVVQSAVWSDGELCRGRQLLAEEEEEEDAEMRIILIL